MSGKDYPGNIEHNTYLLVAPITDDL